MNAFFFDRDGTLNIDPGYIDNPEDMQLFPRAFDVLRYIKSLGYGIFIISNQSGIGRGLIAPEDFRRVNNRFLTLAGGYNIVDDILFCPHTPINNCPCRKPKTLLLEIVKERYSINCDASYFVGDKITDIVCGKRAGLRTIMIYYGNNLEDVSYKFENQIIMSDKIISSISELINIIKE
ncbi:MAG: HAD family hydrolase [Spirochaetota bacterium]|nr:HAD family hydrolase [Spirochaetota bacterium]